MHTTASSQSPELDFPDARRRRRIRRRTNERTNERTNKRSRTAPIRSDPLLRRRKYLIAIQPGRMTIHEASFRVGPALAVSTPQSRRRTTHCKHFMAGTHIIINHDHDHDDDHHRRRRRPDAAQGLDDDADGDVLCIASSFRAGSAATWWKRGERRANGSDADRQTDERAGCIMRRSMDGWMDGWIGPGPSGFTYGSRECVCV